MKQFEKTFPLDILVDPDFDHFYETVSETWRIHVKGNYKDRKWVDYKAINIGFVGGGSVSITLRKYNVAEPITAIVSSENNQIKLAIWYKELVP